jgi:hypothetical protein
MQSFVFKVSDYKRISKLIFGLAVVILPLILFSYYFIREFNPLQIIIIGLVLIILITTVYLSLLKYFLIYESQFFIDETGITEKNLKTEKLITFKWSEVQSFKSGPAKHTSENKEYLTLSFKNSNHTISVAVYHDNKAQMKQFNEFRNNIEKFIHNS